MLDQILSFLFGVGLVGFLAVFISRGFRTLIISSAFYGMDSYKVNQIKESQSFWKRLFMMYIWKNNTIEKRRLGLAIWFLVFHCIQIVATLTFVAMSGVALFIYDIEAQVIIFGFRIDMILLLAVLMIGTLPASFLIGIPVTYFYEKRE